MEKLTTAHTAPGIAAPEHCGHAGTAGAKQFAMLKAQFAQHGHTLHQSGPGDGPGPVSYMAEKWGMARYLPTLDDAEQFLKQVGGSHGL